MTTASQRAAALTLATPCITHTLRPCRTVFDAGLPNLSYQDVDNPREAHRRIKQARDQAPIAIGPYGPELLSYRLVRTVLRDPRFYLPKGMALAAQGITSGPLWDRVAAVLLSLDGAEHDRLRRLVSHAFTPRAVARLRTTIIDIINELVGGYVPLGTCDIVTDIARQYPVPIICALLGVPPADWHLISHWSDDIIKAFGWAAADNAETILAAWNALDTYVDDMISGGCQIAPVGLVARLMRDDHNGDCLSAADMRMLVAGLLIGGTDTTRNQLAAAVDTFCDYPDQWALLAQRPELAANAAEEVMRHSPVVYFTLRIAKVDVALDGLTIPAGTLVFANTAAANRDPAAYDDPDCLDIARQGAPTMLTFGGGPHYCIGAALARLELTEGLRVLAQRMPDLRHSGPAPWKQIYDVSGPQCLPIEFTPGVHRNDPVDACK
ncbi:cytochrome P450 [Mycobacterium sp. CBMA226]|nr:cytochrome P450 [Mycolicibacterium sp. CBMA 226]